MFRYRRVAIDFDGTLFEDVNNIEEAYQSGTKLAAIEGAAEVTGWLKRERFEILIFTCRPDYHRKYMEQLMEENNILHDYILFYTKPRVDLYIDDKGFRFENWSDTKNYIQLRLSDS